MNEPRNKLLILWLPTCLGIRDCTFGLHFTFKYCASPPPKSGKHTEVMHFFCFFFGGGRCPRTPKTLVTPPFPTLPSCYRPFSLFYQFPFLSPHLPSSLPIAFLESFLGVWERCKLPQGCKRNLCILSSKIATGQCFVIYIHAANGKSVGRHWEVGERRSPVFEK